MTFLTGPGGLEVVLEADKRGGFLSSGRDAVTRFALGHHDVRDWAAEVDGWVRRLVEHRAAYGAGAAYGHGAPFADHGQHGHGGHHHDEHHRSGPGAGTAIAAGAAGLAVGVAGGMVAAEVVDEVGDFFEGDDEGEGED